MPQREIDSPSSGGAQLVASLLARIDGVRSHVCVVTPLAPRCQLVRPSPDNSSSVDILRRL
jgi:hypothetical protein